MSKSIFPFIIIAILIVGFVLLITLAVMNINDAKEECSPLKSDDNCLYELCLVDEYGNGDHIDNAEKCLIKQIYMDVPLGLGEQHE